MAPAFTIGFDRPSALRSTAATESKGEPGRIHPEFLPGLFVPERLAHEGKDERLGHAHDRELMPGVAGPVDAAADASHADAEEASGHPGQRRIRL
jgi:hypothetical protein